ncbi:hypothetical protein PIB30_058337 [Stylosanthes scabra]|uniref:Uncharacterized protein n=1 Tax=Stylosanthes scabra TaxID=79078 RepID=A0ABU6YIT4_9FABA|nr:hypothetical protein [Stylosanthes scabra]
MQLSNSQGSGCSSWSRSQGSWMKTPSRDRVTKVPQWCGCGLRPVLRWSGTELNPDRPFYDGEEDDNMAGRHQFEAKIDQGKKNLGFRVSKLEDEIRILKCCGLGLSIVMLAVICGIIWNSLGVGK